MELDRRAFVGLGLAGLPALAGWRGPAGREPLALATADTEAHVVVVGLDRGQVRRRLATVEDPRSIESGPGGHVVVAHPASGCVSLLTMRPARVRRVLRGLGAPRYTAIAPDGGHAFVSDGARGELVVVDLVARADRRGPRGRRRRAPPLPRSQQARTLWIALGSSAAALAVVDVGDPRAPAAAPSRAPAVPGPRRRLLPQRPARVGHGRARAPPGGLPRAPAGAPAARRRRGAPARELRRAASPTWPAATARTVRVHDLLHGRVRRTARVPYGSYNVQARRRRRRDPLPGHGHAHDPRPRGTRPARGRRSPAPPMTRA